MEKKRRETARAKGRALADSAGAREALFKALLSHLSAGFSLESFPDLNKATIEEYCKKYPAEFDECQLGQAQRRGLKSFEEIGVKQAKGLVGGSSQTWKYIMSNRYGWNERARVETDNKHFSNIEVVTYNSDKQSDVDA